LFDLHYLTTIASRQWIYSSEYCNYNVSFKILSHRRCPRLVYSNVRQRNYARCTIAASLCPNTLARNRSLRCFWFSFAWRVFDTWCLKFAMSINSVNQKSVVLFNQRMRTICKFRIRRPILFCRPRRRPRCHVALFFEKSILFNHRGNKKLL
jgi:hypothetical protein